MDCSRVSRRFRVDGAVVIERLGRDFRLTIVICRSLFAWFAAISLVVFVLYRRCYDDYNDLNSDRSRRKTHIHSRIRQSRGQMK